MNGTKMAAFFLSIIGRGLSFTFYFNPLEVPACQSELQPWVSLGLLYNQLHMVLGF
jgi:hypothetical protein